MRLGRIAPGDLVATVDLSAAQPGRRLFHLSPERVKAPFAVVVTQVTPSSVAIRFEPSATRIVPVIASVEGEPAPGFIVGRISADPPTVEIVGPESLLRRVTEAITEPLWVGSARADVRSSVIVGVADEGVRLKSVKTAVVSVAIVPAPEERQLPACRGARAESARRPPATITPPHVQRARARNEGSACEDQGSSIVAYVDLEGIGRGDYGLPVRLEPTAGVGVDQLDPTTVEHSRRMTDALFGTDGIRGTAGIFPLDAATVRRVGAALVKALPHPRTRSFSSAATRGNRACGSSASWRTARDWRAQPCRASASRPTPAVAYLTGSLDFDAGVVISASHNPYQDNGIKVFSGAGVKYGGQFENRIEALVADRPGSCPPATRPTCLRPIIFASICEHARPVLPNPEKLGRVRLAVDCANGAMTTVAPALFRELGFDVTVLGAEPDGQNINKGVGSTHPGQLAASREAGRISVGCRIRRRRRPCHSRRRKRPRARRRSRDADVRQADAGRRPVARQRRRRDRHEQHRAGDRAEEARHRADPHEGRRQVRHGGDAEAESVARRRTVRPS